MRAYSEDLRERVLRAYDQGRWTVRQIAERFEVGEWWIHKLKRERGKEGGTAHGKGCPGRPRSLSEAGMFQVGKAVEENPTATLREIRDKAGATCSLMTIRNTLLRLGYRRRRHAAGAMGWVRSKARRQCRVRPVP